MCSFIGGTLGLNLSMSVLIMESSGVDVFYALPCLCCMYIAHRVAFLFIEVYLNGDFKFISFKNDLISK